MILYWLYLWPSVDTLLIFMTLCTAYCLVLFSCFSCAVRPPVIKDPSPPPLPPPSKPAMYHPIATMRPGQQHQLQEQSSNNKPGGAVVASLSKALKNIGKVRHLEVKGQMGLQYTCSSVHNCEWIWEKRSIHSCNFERTLVFKCLLLGQTLLKLKFFCI